MCWVIFEETKLRHIREGDSAQVVLYSSKQTLQGHVSSIGRAIVDQSVEGGSALVANIKTQYSVGAPRATRTGTYRVR